VAIHYNCRHCGAHVGSLERQSLSSNQLGFESLTQEERKEMLNYDGNGDIHVKTICEDCQESLERNPDYHALHTFLQ
jgi:hypothetical protein